MESEQAAQQPRWGPRALAVAIVAIGAAWLGTGISGGTSAPAHRSAADVRPYAAAGATSRPTEISNASIEDVQLGLGGGTILLLGVAGTLVVRARRS